MDWMILFIFSKRDREKKSSEDCAQIWFAFVWYTRQRGISLLEAILHDQWQNPSMRDTTRSFEDRCERFARSSVSTKADNTLCLLLLRVFFSLNSSENTRTSRDIQLMSHIHCVCRKCFAWRSKPAPHERRQLRHSDAFLRSRTQTGSRRVRSNKSTE